MHLKKLLKYLARKIKSGLSSFPHVKHTVKILLLPFPALSQKLKALEVTDHTPVLLSSKEQEESLSPAPLPFASEEAKKIFHDLKNRLKEDSK